MRVLKFGGSSMADRESILRAVEIIGKKACVVVVSAPGKSVLNKKSGACEEKITDLLYECYRARIKCGRCDVPFLRVEERFLALAGSLGVDGLSPYLTQIKHDINAGYGIGYAAGRGEFLTALILRHLLDCDFVDASELIYFDMLGRPEYGATVKRVKTRLNGCSTTVVPGFYGSMPSGVLKTFSRGGSDVTGALIAAGINAESYENWTDVDGFYSTPVLNLGSPIGRLSYREARELAYFGATVLHPDCLLPLININLPLYVKNTFNPTFCGTLVTKEAEKTLKTVKALAGRGGFRLIKYRTHGSNALLKLCSEAKRRGENVFTAVCGVDSVALITERVLFAGEGEGRADYRTGEPLALITLLGDGEKIISSVAETAVKPLFTQSNGSGVIIGVEEERLDAVLRQLSKRFCI